MADRYSSLRATRGSPGRLFRIASSLALFAITIITLPASAQISTAPDDSFIQITPQQEKTLNLTPPKKTFVVKGGKDSYVPAPRTKDAPEAAAEAVAKTDTDAETKPEGKAEAAKPAAPAVKGHEICDVVAKVIARDFRIIITNQHFRSLDVPTIGSGPYDVAIKSIMPYTSTYTAMDCDGKRLQTIVASVLKQAAAEDNVKKK